jgi:hypothetical protein
MSTRRPGGYKRQPPSVNGTYRAGWHIVGGNRIYFRSGWEVNYAHYLEWLKENKQITEWKFEPVTFWFGNIRRGTVSYLPDFQITELSGKIIYHEVKGRMDARSITKIKRMAKYHPDVTLIVIDSDDYKALNAQLKGLVPGWR